MDYNWSYILVAKPMKTLVMRYLMIRFSINYVIQPVRKGRLGRHNIWGKSPLFPEMMTGLSTFFSSQWERHYSAFSDRDVDHQLLSRGDCQFGNLCGSGRCYHDDNRDFEYRSGAQSVVGHFYTVFQCHGEWFSCVGLTSFSRLLVEIYGVTSIVQFTND